MKKFLSVLLCIALISPTFKIDTFAAPFNVNSFDDTVDDNVGDGICRDASLNCSLRAAVMEANSTQQEDTINLIAGTYEITLTGTGEEAATQGDLDITENIIIYLTNIPSL